MFIPPPPHIQGKLNEADAVTVRALEILGATPTGKEGSFYALGLNTRAMILTDQVGTVRFKKILLVPVAALPCLFAWCVAQQPVEVRSGGV